MGHSVVAMNKLAQLRPRFLTEEKGKDSQLFENHQKCLIRIFVLKIIFSLFQNLSCEIFEFSRQKVTKICNCKLLFSFGAKIQISS